MSRPALILVCLLLCALLFTYLIRFAPAVVAPGADDGGSSLLHPSSHAAVSEFPPGGQHPDPVVSTAAPRWHGVQCMEGTELTDSRLVKKCAAGQVAAHFCDRIHEAERTGTAACGHYSHGAFTPPISDDHLKVPEISDASPACSDFNRAVSSGFVSFSSHPEPELRVKNCESFRYFSPFEAIALLRRASGMNADLPHSDFRGRGILFTGDSMTRQILLRLIAWIRNETVVSEHYFHTDGLYILRRTGDALLPLLSARIVMQHAALIEAFFPGYLSGRKLSRVAATNSPMTDILFVVMFQWETRPSQYRKDFIAHSPILHVASFMYWWQNRQPLKDIEPYIQTAERHFTQTSQRLQNGGEGGPVVPSKFVFITIPWTKPKIHGGVDNENRIPRNERIEEWIFRSPTAYSNRTLKKLLLDYSGIADLRTFSKTQDFIHYMCIWTPKVPEQVNNQKENGRGCTDPMNLAVGQWLLHLLLP